MSRTVLKERVFTPTGRSLGSFSAVDLEPFEMTYTESDRPMKGQPMGQPMGGRKRVPDPVDNNRLTPKDDGKKNKGKGVDPFSKGGGKDDRDDTVPDTWDPNGNDIDDIERANTPNTPDIEPSTGNNNSSGNNSSGNQQGQDGQSGQGGQSGNGQQKDSSNPVNDALDDIKKKAKEIADKIADKIKNGELSSENDIDQAMNDIMDDIADEISKRTGMDRDSIRDELGKMFDGIKQEAKEKSQQGNNPNKSDDIPHYNKGTNDKPQPGGADDEREEAENSTKLGVSKLLDADDEEEEDENREKSDMEKAIEKANKSRSAAEKKKEEDDKTFEEERRREENKKSPLEKREEAKKTGDMIREAIGEAKKEIAEKKRNGEIKEGEDDEMDTLFRTGASKITNVGNGKMRSDWKAKLERVLTTASGQKITMNPNLINKRIENAPPGREDIVPEIANIAILIDQSGSMGAIQFKQVINHIDSILSAKKLGHVKFHIIGWGTSDWKTVAKTYTKCKGKDLKRTMINKFSDAPWGTQLAPALQVAAKVLKKPDAIMIFTDCALNDFSKVQSDPICQRFMTKYKNKLIWVLTQDASLSNLKMADPYAYSHDMYVKFKKGSK